ncbi:MAG: methylated-DNA--[protein]-cysteine S-methyltransferase [Candidatus Binatia bacterium]
MTRQRTREHGLSIGATRDGVGEVRLKGRSGTVGVWTKDESSLARRWGMTAKEELSAYFTGQLRSFSTPSDLSGLPLFTQAVLRITAKIPYGEVRSYRWVAERLGKPKATRAVGNALARNPIPIIIPCHRVVRADGSLGGYALGLDWKRKLLELEQSYSRPQGVA